jgi:hypothetical protein
MAAACTSTNTIVGYADDTYYAQIDACVQQGDCIHLCTDVLKIDPSVIDRAKILVYTPTGAKFACEIVGTAPIDYAGGILDDSVSWDGDSTCDSGCDDTSSSSDPSGGDSTTGDSSGTVDTSSSNDGGGCSDSGGDTSSSDGGCSGDSSSGDCATGGDAGNSTFAIAGLAACLIARRRRTR